MRSASCICSAAASSRCWPVTSRRSAARLASVAADWKGAPAVLAAARRELGSLAGRPPSRLHTEMAIKQLPGIAALAEDALAQAEAAAGQPGVTAVPPRLRAAAAGRARRIERFEAWLRADLLPRSVGEGRLGADLFAGKLRHTFRSDLTADEILAQAAVEYDAVRGEMIRIARGIWADVGSGRAASDRRGEAARRPPTRGPSLP